MGPGEEPLCPQRGGCCGGPAAPLTAQGRPLTAERSRSLSGPSRKRPKLRPLRSRAAPKSPERFRRSPRASSEHVRSFPNSRTPSVSGKSRSFPSAGVTGGAGLSAEGGGAGGSAGRQGACAREGLRKEPRFPERRSPASGSGKSRRLPSAGGPSGSGAARRRPSVRPAGLLEAAAAPCLMLRYFSEENPPASPESRHREGLRCPRGGGPRPPAAGGS